MRTLTAAAVATPPFLCKKNTTLRSSIAPRRIQATNSSMATADSDHRLMEIHKFESTKRGVKGLVDEGITSLPPIFVHPPGFLADTGPGLPEDAAIPTVDLSGGTREEIAAEVARACREVGFFQVVNHGVPLEVMERTVGAVKGFHEMDAEEKARFYGRDLGTGVSFISNVDLFRSKAASWRDTLQVRLGPSFPNPEDIPEICRNEVSEWNRQSTRVAELLMELMCEGLGLDSGRLKELACSERRMMVGHYYPSCPQPDLTVGISCHTDPGVLTIVLQDQVGGLQVKLGGKWVDVKPVPGALVINVGDILQMMSNDEFKSIEHRVLANPTSEPRISVGVFFNSSNLEGIFGPLPELVSPDKPARYKQVTLMEYLKTFFARELGDKSVKDHFKL